MGTMSRFECTKCDYGVTAPEGISIGMHAVIAAQVGIAGSTVIGNNVKIGGQAGISGHLSIGDNVSLNGVAITSMNKISIGESTMVAGNVLIIDTDFHHSSLQKDRHELCNTNQDHAIEIGNNVWIGASVIVLKGVSIGDNSVISAGSIVSKDIPSNVIAAGNPALTVAKLD